MYSKKQYVEIAEILNENSSPNVQRSNRTDFQNLQVRNHNIPFDQLVEILCRLFENDNPNFKRSYFKKAVYKLPKPVKPEPIGRDKISAAFRELRKDKWIARMNYLCCSTCGWAEIEGTKWATKIKNVVFFHNQDNDRLKETGKTYLSWSGNGKKLVKVLKKHKLKPIWDGENTTRISININ